MGDDSRIVREGIPDPLRLAPRGNVSTAWKAGGCLSGSRNPRRKTRRSGWRKGTKDLESKLTRALSQTVRLVLEWDAAPEPEPPPEPVSSPVREEPESSAPPAAPWIRTRTSKTTRSSRKPSKFSKAHSTLPPHEYRQDDEGGPAHAGTHGRGPERTRRPHDRSHGRRRQNQSHRHRRGRHRLDSKSTPRSWTRRTWNFSRTSCSPESGRRSKTPRRSQGAEMGKLTGGLKIPGL